MSTNPADDEMPLSHKTHVLEQALHQLQGPHRKSAILDNVHDVMDHQAEEMSDVIQLVAMRRQRKDDVMFESEEEAAMTSRKQDGVMLQGPEFQTEKRKDRQLTTSKIFFIVSFST